MYSETVLCTLFYILKHFVATEKNGDVSYEGAQVWRTQLQNSDDVFLMKKLIDSEGFVHVCSSDKKIVCLKPHDRKISIWTLSPKHADFLIHPERKVKVHRLLNSRNLNHTVLIMDVQRKMDALKPVPVMWDDFTLRLGHRLTWTTYPTLKTIDEYINFLSETYSSICKVHHIGYSTEGRSIKMIHITNGNPNNKGVLVTSGIHSREWIAVTSGLYILDRIVTNFDQQKDYIKNKDWYIIPMVNPDGYLYSYTHDRLWRKNRRKSGRCIGIDINRNFGTNWAVHGITEYNQCKPSYAGSHSYSEKETVALRDTVLKYKNKLDAMLDLHSFGQLILFPWSARSQPTPDAKLHKTNAEGMIKAIYSTTKLKYKCGATYHVIYPATGSLLDWAYASGVKLSYSIEGRDTGTHGFLLPPDHIEDGGKEMFSAVSYLAKSLETSFIQTGTNNSWF